MQEEEDYGVKLRFEGVAVEVSYGDPRRAARGLVARSASDEFVVAGIGAGAGFCDDYGRPLAIASAERGRFDGEEWRPRCAIRREGNDRTEPVHLVTPQVVRIRIEPASRGA